MICSAAGLGALAFLLAPIALPLLGFALAHPLLAGLVLLVLASLLVWMNPRKAFQLAKRVVVGTLNMIVDGVARLLERIWDGIAHALGCGCPRLPRSVSRGIAIVVVGLCVFLFLRSWANYFVSRDVLR